MVIEEFGLPRDGQSLDPNTSALYRDDYYKKVLSLVSNQPRGDGYIAGVNFWAFGGTARPKKGQIYWKAGEEI